MRIDLPVGYRTSRPSFCLYLIGQESSDVRSSATDANDLWLYAEDRISKPIERGV